MKENSHRSMLAYVSPILQANTVNNLGFSIEVKLSRNTLQRKANIESSDEYLKDRMKLFHKSTHAKSHPFIYVSQWNDHWTRCEEKTDSHISGLHHGH